jgi:hypothetical protein
MSETTKLIKRDIFIILSGGTPLHAVYTERQARKFVESYGPATEDCRLFLGVLHYQKVKLLPPRRVSEKQAKVVKQIIAKSLFGENASFGEEGR